MAKWVVVSDTQFDEQLSYATIGSDGISSRLADSIRCFDWIVDYALLEKCEGLIHLGDVFDSRTSIDVSVLDQVGRVMWRAHDEGLKLRLLTGNHDSYLRSSKINSLWPLAGVADVIDEPSVFDQFAFIPWTEDDDAFAEALDFVINDKDAEFLFAHCMIEGAVPAAIGVGRPLLSLQPKRWRQVLLGDVHEPVQLAPNVRYAGSPMQWHYGDAGRSRGFLILDDEKGTVTFVENTHSPRFHLIKKSGDVSQVRDGDFVRVESDDLDVVAKVRKAVSSKKLQRVEATIVETVMDEAPRLSVRVKDQHEDVLRRYIEYQGVEGDEAEALLALSLEVLEEARGG